MHDSLLTTRQLFGRIPSWLLIRVNWEFLVAFLVHSLGRTRDFLCYSWFAPLSVLLEDTRKFFLSLLLCSSFS